MIFERQIKKWGDSLAIILPKDLCQYIELEEGTEIQLQDETGKKGKYASIWKKENVQDNKQ